MIVYYLHIVTILSRAVKSYKTEVGETQASDAGKIFKKKPSPSFN